MLSARDSQTKTLPTSSRSLPSMKGIDMINPEGGIGSGAGRGVGLRGAPM